LRKQVNGRQAKGEKPEGPNPRSRAVAEAVGRKPRGKPASAAHSARRTGPFTPRTAVGMGEKSPSLCGVKLSPRPSSYVVAGTAYPARGGETPPGACGAGRGQISWAPGGLGFLRGRLEERGPGLLPSGIQP